MGKLERLAIVVALAGVGLAVVAAAGCGSVAALTDAAGVDAGAAGAGGSGGAAAATAGTAGTAAGAAGQGGNGGAGGSGGAAAAGGAAGDVDAGQADAGVHACGAPVRNVGVSCASKSGGLACATCVATADSSARYDCRGSISGAPVYCFPAGVSPDLSGCDQCP